jgi:hypothetical protein
MRRLAIAGLMFFARVASADPNDLTLERLVGPAMPGVFNDPTDPARQSQFRSLMSELGVAMAPKFLSPADTLGWSGFQVSFDTTFTAISNKASFWQNGVENVSGGYLPTLSVWARKGIWLPLPSFELGAGMTKLINSNMWSVQAYAKLGIHEGYHGWAVPSIAIRGAVSHVLGEPEIDLTIGSLDVSLSKSFGIGGTVKLDPYLGANVLWIIPRSQIIDTTPNIDAYRQGPNGIDLDANTAFADQENIVRWRIFTGFRLVWSILALTGEVAYTLCNNTGASCRVDNPQKVLDLSDGQIQLSFSGSLLY